LTVEALLRRYEMKHGTSLLTAKKASLLIFVNGVAANLGHTLAEGDSVTVARLLRGG